MALQPIFTLNSRENIMLEFWRDYYKLTSTNLYATIQSMHQTTIQTLTAKGIDYSKLRSALVPMADRNEAGFIFDSDTIKSNWYGLEVMRQVLPLLDPRATQSVLHGDLLGKDQSLILEILNESMVISHPFVFRYSTLLYCVYINNLSNAELQRIHQRLAMFPAYLGYIPATFRSRAKTFLSTTLTYAFLKHGRKIIMRHEDDRSDEENVNVLGYPFDGFGYRVFSLRSMYSDLFLFFKIERPVYTGFEVDTDMSLNAISNQVYPLNDFKVLLEPAKYHYLKVKKLGRLQTAGLADFDCDRIASLIKSQVAGNYIYNMIYLAEYDVAKFNLLIEVERESDRHPIRVTVAVEYLPKEKALRVITLY